MRALSLVVVTSLLLSGCSRKQDPIEDPVANVIARARPELRKPMTAMCAPPLGYKNVGDELELAYRIHLATEIHQYRRAPRRDIASWKSVFTNTAVDVYSRMGAAYFLQETYQPARTFLTNYFNSNDLRLRFNVVRTVQWFAAHNPPGEARAWASGELEKLIENRGLEVKHEGELLGKPGEVAEMDELRNPSGPVSWTLELLNEPLSEPADRKTMIALENEAIHAAESLDRKRAINQLARTAGINALHALVRIAETNAPPPKRMDKHSIETGMGKDLSRFMALKRLFERTGQSFGADGESWRRWLTVNFTTNQLPAVVR